MRSILKKARDLNFLLDLVLILLLCATAPLFFYKLGQMSLISWDEAWYAEIARNIFKTGEIAKLSFNDRIYSDHPFLGFLLMSWSFKLLGVSEFSARLPSALTGFVGIIIIYLLGKQLFNRWVGFASGLALASSFWYIYRSRSGNLDIFLTVLFLLTIFLSFKSLQNKKYLVVLPFSLTALFLTKTLVPFTILPALVIIFFRNKVVLSDRFFFFIIVSVILFGSWVVSQINYVYNFVGLYFAIGYPGAKVQSDYVQNASLLKEYLHSGIGKWFWPGVAGLILGTFTFQKRFLVFSVFVLVFIIPFIFSPKGQIWHLIPLHPILILTFFGCLYFFSEKIITYSRKIKVLDRGLIKKVSFIVPGVLVLVFSLYFSIRQIRQMWYQFIEIPRYVSDEAILSKEAGKYPHDFYIAGENYAPAAIFYSGKNVNHLWEGSLPEMFTREKPFVIITTEYLLKKYQIPLESYNIIKKDRDKFLIIYEGQKMK